VLIAEPAIARGKVLLSSSCQGVCIVTLAGGDVNKMLISVMGLLGSMFLDDLDRKPNRARLVVSNSDVVAVGLDNPWHLGLPSQ
jgi:hypothetical protein